AGSWSSGYSDRAIKDPGQATGLRRRGSRGNGDFVTGVFGQVFQVLPGVCLSGDIAYTALQVRYLGPSREGEPEGFVSYPFVPGRTGPIHDQHRFRDDL